MPRNGGASEAMVPEMDPAMAMVAIGLEIVFTFIETMALLVAEVLIKEVGAAKGRTTTEGMTEEVVVVVMANAVDHRYAQIILVQTRSSQAMTMYRRICLRECCCCRACRASSLMR